MLESGFFTAALALVGIVPAPDVLRSEQPALPMTPSLTDEVTRPTMTESPLPIGASVSSFILTTNTHRRGDQMMGALRHLFSRNVTDRQGLPSLDMPSPYDQMRERLRKQTVTEAFVTDDNKLRPLKRGRHVYIMTDGEMPIKIGVSNDPLRRCADIRGPSGRPLSVAFAIESAYADEIERLAHKHFTAERTMFEWFNVSVEDARAAIEAIANKLDSSAQVVSVRDLCRSVASHVPTLEMPVRAAVAEFFHEMSLTSAGKEILFRDVCKSYAAMAPARMWPRLSGGISEKMLGQMLVKLGCTRGRRDLRKDDLGRLATLTWPVQRAAASLKVVS